MDTVNTPSPSSRDFAERLAVPTARLRRARVVCAAHRGLHRANWIVLAGSVVVLLISAASMVMNASLTREVSFLAAAVFAGAMVSLLWPVARAWWRPIALRDVAERVDLELENHNAIATALTLSSQPVVSGFESLAIEQGMMQLDRAQIARMHIEPAPRAGLRQASVLCASVIAFAGAFVLLQPSPRVSSADTSARKVDGVAVALNIPREPAEEHSEARNESADRADRAGSARRVASTAAASAEPGSATASTGSQSGDADAASASVSNPPAAPQAASPAKASTDSLPSPRQGDRPARSSPETSAGDADASGSTDSTSSASSSGSASASPSAPDLNPVPIMLRPPEQQSGADEAQDAASPTNPSESSYQTAAQPLRQDRNQSTSRELGQSGTTGGKGNGRGGPGDTKKTRGVGAVFLSVPIPDFLAGRLSSGTSRVTRTVVPPLQLAAQPPEPASAAREAIEDPIRRFDIHPTDAAAVSKYLEAIRTDSDPDATSAADRQPTEGESIP